MPKPSILDHTTLPLTLVFFFFFKGMPKVTICPAVRFSSALIKTPEGLIVWVNPPKIRLSVAK